MIERNKPYGWVASSVSYLKKIQHIDKIVKRGTRQDGEIP
jgi:hypothetical protein